MLNAIDLFSGCGGLSLGLANAGIKICAAMDNWSNAVDVYKANFDHPVYQQDLSDVNETCSIIKKYNINMIVGGPPCQDFSSAGKQDYNGKRADLTYKYAEIISNIDPDFFIMENVERIRKSHILKDVIESFKKQGYGLTACILDASYCGVPQCRNRFFLIGHKGASHNFLLDYLKSGLAKMPMTMRDYFGNDLNLEYYYRHPRSYARRGVFSIDEPSPTVRGVNRPVPPSYKLHKGDPADLCLKSLRPLTTIERSYIQTFPKGFKFNDTKTNLEQMMGNAVPVKLAEYIGRAIINYCNNKEPPIRKTLIDIEELFIPDRALHLEDFIG